MDIMVFGRACAAGVLVIGTSSALSAPLNLTLDATPDLSAAFISVNYDSSLASLELAANGFAITYDNGGGQINVGGGGTFIVDANVDNSGNLVNGMLTITGTIPSLNANSGTLLTADLVAFGFAGPGEPLEFHWNVTGGDLASDYGTEAATIMSLASYPGNWDQDWSDSFVVADTGRIPAPATLPLLGAGIAVLARRRR